MGSGRREPKRRVSCQPTPGGATARSVAVAGGAYGFVKSPVANAAATSRMC